MRSVKKKGQSLTAGEEKAQMKRGRVEGTEENDGGG